MHAVLDRSDSIEMTLLQAPHQGRTKTTLPLSSSCLPSSTVTTIFMKPLSTYIFSLPGITSSFTLVCPP